MLNAKDFIQRKLKQWYQNIEDIKIRYEFRPNIKTHIIEVLPIELCHNEDYMILEIELLEEFNNIYLNEEILFITKGGLNEIINPNLSLEHEPIELPYTAYGFESNWNGLSLNSSTILETVDNTSYALAA